MSNSYQKTIKKINLTFDFLISLTFYCTDSLENPLNSTRTKERIKDYSGFVKIN